MRHFSLALTFGVFFCGLGAATFVCYQAQPGESLRVDECKQAMIEVFTPATPLARNPHLAHLWINPNPLTTVPGFARHRNCVVLLQTTTALNAEHNSLGPLMRAATLLFEHCVQRTHVGGIVALGDVSIRIVHVQAFNRVPNVTWAQSIQQAADSLSLSPHTARPRPSLSFPVQRNDAPPALKQAADALSLYPPGLPPLGSSAVAENKQIMRGSPLQSDPARTVFTPFHLLPPLQHGSQAHAVEVGSQLGHRTLRAMPTLPTRPKRRI